MMRQPEQHRTYSTTSIWPLLFWARCFKCGLEFRRERGWRFLSNMRFRQAMDNACFCQRCFDGQDQVEDYIQSWAPPPPPILPKGKAYKSTDVAFAHWWCCVRRHGPSDMESSVLRLIRTRECLDDGDSYVLEHYDTWCAAAKSRQ